MSEVDEQLQERSAALPGVDPPVRAAVKELLRDVGPAVSELDEQLQERDGELADVYRRLVAAQKRAEAAEAKCKSLGRRVDRLVGALAFYLEANFPSLESIDDAPVEARLALISLRLLDDSDSFDEFGDN